MRFASDVQFDIVSGGTDPVNFIGLQNKNMRRVFDG
jgi:hypothetical protein